MLLGRLIAKPSIGDQAPSHLRLGAFPTGRVAQLINWAGCDESSCRLQDRLRLRAADADDPHLERPSGFVTNSWAPTQEELGMQVGKQAYPSMDEANIDLKVVCDNS